VHKENTSVKTDHLFEGIKHVVHISSSVGQACEHCNENIGSDRFAESVNHYIEKHSYRLLHVGTETDRDDEGHPWQQTVAVLGK
jgi:hypothetical protein